MTLIATNTEMSSLLRLRIISENIRAELSRLLLSYIITENIYALTDIIEPFGRYACPFFFLENNNVQRPLDENELVSSIRLMKNYLNSVMNGSQTTTLRPEIFNSILHVCLNNSEQENILLVDGIQIDMTEYERIIILIQNNM